MSEAQPAQQLIQMITGSWISRAIYVAAKLQIADLLADGPRSAEELAEDAGVAPRPLYRVLRALGRLHQASPRFSTIARARVASALADLENDALVSAVVDRLRADRRLVGDARSMA